MYSFRRLGIEYISQTDYGFVNKYDRFLSELQYSFNKHMSRESNLEGLELLDVNFHGLVIEEFEQMKTEMSCQMCFELFLLIPSGGCLRTSLFWNEEMRSSVVLYCGMSGIMISGITCYPNWKACKMSALCRQYVSRC